MALNKPAAGNKKSSKKPFVEGGDKKERAPREGREGAPRGGRGGARGGRGGREGAPRRDFERRSGTGRGKETSKQGGGARNWGNQSDKTELVAEAEVQEKTVSDEEVAVVVEEVVEEEEEVQFSLDEYLAKKKAERKGELFAEVEVRTITTEFSGAVQITKDGKTPDFIEAQFEKVFTKKTSGRKKQFITDLGFQAPKEERRPFRENDTRGRGGRGGARGGRGGARGGRAAGGSTPNVADLKAFPSLG